jgi:hypothetical protein
MWSTVAIVSSGILDSTTLGRSLVTVADAAALRTLAGLGTSATLNVDTDGTLAANSDSLIATQKAVKSYVDGLLSANDVMVFKGVLDCSANPNYPAANAGDNYRVSVAGKIGGASGVNVDPGDWLICTADGTASGNHATVGSSWAIIQANLDGILTTADIGVSLQGYDAGLQALAAFNTNGIVCQTADNTFAGRTLTGVTNRTTVTNGDGVSGNPTIDISATYAGQATITTVGVVSTGTWQGSAVAVLYGGTGSTTASGARTSLGLAIGSDVQAYDAGLVSLASLSATGIVVCTADNVFTSRTLTGTSNKITVTNGDGVSGAPTVDIAGTYVGQTSITTLGTITTGGWQGTAVAVLYGGTGATSASAARRNLGTYRYVTTSDASKVSNTTYGVVNGELAHALTNNVRYHIVARIPFTSGSSGGIKTRLGTLLPTTIRGFCRILDLNGAVVAAGRVTDYTTSIGLTAVASGIIEWDIYAHNTSGSANIAILFAQNASNATATIALEGSTMEILEQD